MMGEAEKLAAITGGYTLAALVVNRVFSYFEGRRTRRAVRRGARDIMNEVQTMNGQTLAQLSDAIESRRIESVPVAKQTVSDKEHLERAAAVDELPKS